MHRSPVHHQRDNASRPIGASCPRKAVKHLGYIVWILLLAIVAVATFVVSSSIKRSAELELAKEEAGRNNDSRISDLKFERTAASRTRVIVVTVVLLLAFFSTLFASARIVDAGQVGVVYQFGDIVGQRSSGVQFIAPWQSIKTQSIQVQRFSNNGEDDPPYVGFSKETQDVYIRITLNYSVSPNAVQGLYRNVGTNWFEKLVEPRIQNFIKEETVKYEATDIAPNRETFRLAVKKRLSDELAPFSITVQDLLIDNVDFDPELKASIVRKQVAQQEAQAAQNKVVQSKAEAEQAVAIAQGQADSSVVAAKGRAEAIRLEAEGQAAANKALTASLSDALIQYTSIQKLNPNVQVILLPSDSNFILPAEFIKP